MPAESTPSAAQAQPSADSVEDHMAFWEGELGQAILDRQAAENRADQARHKIAAAEALLELPSPPFPLAVGQKKRQRRSKSREKSTAVLSARPGKQLTEQEIIEAIVQDFGRRFSGQAINAALKWLVGQGRAKKERAPSGRSAKYVYSHRI